MKKILVILLMLAIAATGFSQVLWEKTWGGPYDDGCEVRNTSDGGMIAMASYGMDSWLMRLDNNGDTIWTYRVRQPIDLCAVTETLDGGFLATGLTRTQHRDLVAWKFDYRGDSLWMRVYIDSVNSEGMYTITRLADSTFLLTGYTSANGYDMLALRIDSLGDTIWRRTYGGSGFEGGTMAAPTADGGFVFATTGGGTFSSNIWVVRVNSVGDTLWSHNYLEPYPTGGPVPTVTSDGKILIMGWIQRTDFDNYLLCLDSLGNRLWTRSYNGIGFESRSAKGVIEDRFGGYTFASSVDFAYGPSGSDHDIALLRIDTMGTVQQIYRVGRQGDEMPRYFEQAGNGDYLLFGYSSSFISNGQQTYLARLQPYGCSAYFYDLAAPLRDTICPGDSVVLDAGSGFVQYLWSDGDSSQMRPVTQTDTLYVQAIDSQGCIHYSNGVAFLAIQGPQFTWSVTGNLMVQFDGIPGNGALFQWDFGDGDSSFVQDPIHAFALPGTYPVCFQAFVPNCGWEAFCDSVTVTQPISTGEPIAQMPRYYPNPANSTLMLENPFETSLTCELRNLQGAVLATISAEAHDAVAWNISGVAQGIYLIQMTTDKVRLRPQKLVIAR